MTRKDYKKIAEAISFELRVSKRLEDKHSRSAAVLATEQVAQSLANVLERDNPLFNRGKFLKACEVI